MHCTRYMLIICIITSSQLHSLSFIERYAHKIRSFFTRYSVEKIDHKEFPTHSLQSISIENCSGPITIKTGWKKKSLCLKTTKRTKNSSYLDTIKIIINSSKPHHLSIHTKQLYNSNSGLVEYELIIPSSLSITLKTGDGNIYINDIHGNITAVTNNGNIHIFNTHDTIYAESSTSGSIHIENALGSIKTTTRYGSITIHDASNTINAYAKKGNVIVSYKDLSPAHNLSLETSSGNISVALPTGSDATINGITVHGKIVSDHYITIKPYTTQLNAHAWNKLKKEVCGTIGSGKTNITLSSLYGNINILETKIPSISHEDQ